MIAGANNRGAAALMLCRLQADADGKPITARLTDIAGGWQGLERWESGEVLPGESEREEIGRLTDGAVTGAMWDEAVPAGVQSANEETGNVIAFSRFSKTIDLERPAPAPALLCEISGPLGTMPSGAPFRVMTDPVAPGLFVLAGPGVALVLDESLGWAMCEALTMGLQDIRAEARPIAAAAGRTIG